MNDAELLSHIQAIEPLSKARSDAIRSRLLESAEFRSRVQNAASSELTAKLCRELDLDSATLMPRSVRLRKRDATLHTSWLFVLVALGVAAVSLHSLFESESRDSATEQTTAVVTDSSLENDPSLDEPTALTPVTQSSQRSGRARHQTVTADEPGLALKSTDVKAGNTDETVVQTSSGSPRDGNDVKPAVVLEALDPAPEFDGLKPILEQTTPLKKMLAVADSDRGKGRFEKQDKDGVADLRGTFRLTKDWQADSLLRVEFGESPDQLDFSFWRGEHGVLFRHYPHSAISWAAYKVSRDGRNPDPNSFILLDTDSGIFKRIGSLRLEIRHQDGHLVAASLGRVLMVVPFPDPPEQVFLADTKARFQNIALERSGPIPIAQHEFPLHREINRPADEQWDTRLSEGSKVTPLDDGSIRLTAARPEETAFVAMPFNHVGFHEVAFLIESPTPQTGVFLGTKHRRHPVGFFEETVRRKRVLEFAEGRSWQTTMKVDERLTPYIPDRVWVKIRAGVNAIGIWMSHDGKRWFLASAPIEHRHGALTEFGIYAAHGNTPRSITLKKVELRHLPTILQIADPELLAKTPSFARANNNHEWFRIAAAAIPEGVPLVEWRRACAVKALSQTPAVSLMSSLWAEVFRDGLTRPDWNHQQRQKFTREMFALMPLLKRWWPPSPFRTFEEVEHLRFHHGQPSLISTFTEAARTGDGTTIDRLDVMPYAALRLRMLDDFNRARLQDVHERSLAFRLGGRTLDWRHEQQHMNGFIEWLAPQVKRQIKTARLPMPVRNVDDVPFPAHPLQQAVNKETYNLFAELAGHLDAGDFGSAAEVVLQSSGKLTTGLLPASDDTRLFVSSSQAIKNATEQYAGLAEALDRSASLVQLRVSQAFAQQDWDELRQIVHWFPGTSAAAQANRHLGDRTLAQGNFTVASQHFAEAMKVSAVAKRELRPRYYLAEAMDGRLNGLDLAAPDAELDLPDTVEFGGASMTRSEFLSLLADVQDAPPESPEHSVTKRLPVHSPCDISIASWGSEPFAGQQYANRRTAGTIHDGRMFVSDGMTIDCFNVTDGQLKWRRQFRSGDQADDQPLTRLEPMMIGDALIARVETDAGRERPRQGPRLVRLDPLTGKTQHESRAGILTDPLQLNGMLFAITADVNLAAPHFALSAFDPLSLDESLRTPLLTSAPFFSRVQYPTFQVVHADGILIATGAGCTLKVDLEGKVQWLRQHKWNPPRRFDRSWAMRGHPQPIVRAGRIYVTQPGTTEVECLELQSGKQIWRRTFDDPLAITRGLHGLVVATGRAIHCLNFENGKLVWMNNTPLVSPGHLVASGSNESAGTITFVCKAVIRNQRFIPAIAWLDSATGIELHRSLLGDTERQTPVVGAFISDGDRVWLPYAGDKSSGKMQLVELHTKPVNCVRLNAEYPLEDWDFYRDINISKAWKSMFPTWRLTMHRYDLKSDYRNELNGETSALITSMNRDWPTQIVREIKLPQGPCTLSMRVGHLGEPWTLSVRVNQQEIHSQSIGETGKSGWVDVEVDLAPHTAKRIWLTIEANSESNNYACWKRLALEAK